MLVYALDPGYKETALVILDAATKKVLRYAYAENNEIIKSISTSAEADGRYGEDVLCIEKIEFMRQIPGMEVFDTVHWSGRFHQAWEAVAPGRCYLVTRRQVKLHLCGTMQAKDPQIRQAVAEGYGGPERAKGSKRMPGPLYGISGHLWQALAVGLTWIETALPFEQGRPRYEVEAEREAERRA